MKKRRDRCEVYLFFLVDPGVDTNVEGYRGMCKRFPRDERKPSWDYCGEFNATIGEQLRRDDEHHQYREQRRKQQEEKDEQQT